LSFHEPHNQVKYRQKNKVFSELFTNTFFVITFVTFVSNKSLDETNHRLNSTSTTLLIRNSTSTIFIPIALKFVQVEFVLVETVLVGDPLYTKVKNMQANCTDTYDVVLFEDKFPGHIGVAIILPFTRVLF
jgi:hypothetical protein